jgi:hypothetical protein
MARIRDHWAGEIGTSSSLMPAVGLGEGDVAVPQRINWTVDGAPGTPGRGWPDVRAEFEMRDGVPTCVEFHVTCKPGDRGITTGNLRTFDLEAIARRAFMLHSWTALPGGGWGDVPARNAQEVFGAIGAAIERRWDDPLEELREVARTYLDPDNRGAQRRAVAQRLAKSDETASRRINSARAAGLIPAKGATDDELRAAFDALGDDDRG